LPTPLPEVSDPGTTLLLVLTALSKAWYLDFLLLAFFLAAASSSEASLSLSFSAGHWTGLSDEIW
jgi:hypothetical protein